MRRRHTSVAVFRLLSPSSPADAAWVLRCLWLLRGHRPNAVLHGGLDLPPPPRAGSRADAAVAAVLRASRATCLRAALVRQRWEAAQGRDREVVIGVTAPSRGFRAHAWLDGDDPCHHEGFEELLRVGPR